MIRSVRPELIALGSSAAVTHRSSEAVRLQILCSVVVTAVPMTRTSGLSVLGPAYLVQPGKGCRVVSVPPLRADEKEH